MKASLVLAASALAQALAASKLILELDEREEHDFLEERLETYSVPSCEPLPFARLTVPSMAMKCRCSLSV